MRVAFGGGIIVGQRPAAVPREARHADRADAAWAGTGAGRGTRKSSMSFNRTVVTASRYAISSGHQLATEAGLALLDAGGNAVDAGVAAGIALEVLHCDLVNVAGVAPIMIRMAATGEVITIDGLGTWPAAASVDVFEREHGGAIPEGILRTVVPAAPAAWITALRHFGTMTFAEVAAAALRCAREGFPVYPLFAQFITNNEASYRRWAENRRIFLPEGRPPRVGELFVQEDLAASLQYMIDQERAAAGDREQGLKAAYDAFYRGDIARTICDYHRENGGLLRLEDMADYRVRFEPPVKVGFAGYDIYCCGPWCQGLSLAQVFAMLESHDVVQYGHNSADYIHNVTEALKLVFADREQYVADPLFVDVPVAEMLEGHYLSARAGLIDGKSAWPEMPPPGDPRRGRPTLAGAPRHPDAETPGGDAHATKPMEAPPEGGPASADTSYVCVIDGEGNMFSATPSDTSADTEVIPGTGLCPSSRGSQSRGLAGSINAVAPGKRPRLTPNPALALKGGEPFMVFGTPGGDVQIQAMVQVFLNATRFGMDIQAAITAPRFATYSFPSSFAPNDYFPGQLMLESRISEQTGADLAGRGHKVDWWPDFTWKAGGVCAVQVDADSGVLSAGADPRRAGQAQGR
jgi:gamma-glutamyltranspeptidase/glutathione hydrolase